MKKSRKKRGIKGTGLKIPLKNYFLSIVIYIKIPFLTGRNYHINKFNYNFYNRKVNLANLYE